MNFASLLLWIAAAIALASNWYTANKITKRDPIPRNTPAEEAR